MEEFRLVEVTQEMRDKWLHDEIMNKALIGAVQEQLDEWVAICRSLGYQRFSEATERAQNIIDLIKKYREISRKHPNSEFIEYEELDFADTVDEENTEDTGEMKWIKCSDELPKEEGEYLASGDGKVWICKFLLGQWIYFEKYPSIVAWMPLPKPY